MSFMPKSTVRRGGLLRSICLPVLRLSSLTTVRDAMTAGHLWGQDLPFALATVKEHEGLRDMPTLVEAIARREQVRQWRDSPGGYVLGSVILKTIYSEEKHWEMM
eukprot:15445173-Alexandrium_andersonii.AAC.1